MPFTVIRSNAVCVANCHLAAFNGIAVGPRGACIVVTLVDTIDVLETPYFNRSTGIVCLAPALSSMLVHSTVLLTKAPFPVFIQRICYNTIQIKFYIAPNSLIKLDRGAETRQRRCYILRES